ncbi:MAG: hypothetical protein HXX09_01575 [Bacteroidetes bacterium]|nr:hypothetical protein [Bacteroidota bacterium]
MKKIWMFLSTIALLWLSGCGVTKNTIIPLSSKLTIEDTYTIIWNGTSEAYRFTNDKWERDESYDYQFDVIQKRYNNHWKSIKSLHRRNPNYDGKAGDRDQTMYFELKYSLKDGNIISELTSSLGNGNGTTDKEFRNQTLDFNVIGISKYAPYDHLRITQEYKYEQGILEETVFLYKLKEGKEIPFMKNLERAYFYMKGNLNSAPTTFNQ